MPTIWTWTITNPHYNTMSNAAYDLLLNGEPELSGMLYDEIYNHIFWHSKPADIVSGDGPDSTVRTRWLHEQAMEACFDERITSSQAVALMRLPDDVIARDLGVDFVATRK